MGEARRRMQQAAANAAALSPLLLWHCDPNNLYAARTELHARQLYREDTDEECPEGYPVEVSEEDMRDTLRAFGIPGPGGTLRQLLDANPYPGLIAGTLL